MGKPLTGVKQKNDVNQSTLMLEVTVASVKDWKGVVSSLVSSGVVRLRCSSNEQDHGEPMEDQNIQPGWGWRPASSVEGALLGPELPLLPPRHVQSAGHLISSLTDGTSLTPSPHILREGPRTRLPARGCHEKPRTG